MIAHLNILLQLISLFAGFVSAFYIYQKWKYYGRDFLQWLFYAVVVTNLWIIVNLTSKYVHVNILGGIRTPPGFSWGMVLRHPVSTILIIFMTIAFLKFVQNLSENNSLGKLIKFFNIFAALAVINYAGGLVYYIDTLQHDWMVFSDIWINRISLFVIYFGGIFSIIKYRSGLIPEKKLKVFISAYLAGYVGFVLMFFALPLKLTFMSALFIYLNLVPLSAVYKLKEYLEEIPAVNNFSELLSNLKLKYELSEREADILTLLIEGKANKEIEKELFISVNTVRNHIHNIYRKLGINSRGQLMKFIIQELNQIK